MEKNNYRNIARIILEAQTPLFVGSGEASLLKDALVQRDFQGLPMIPGTALAGVLRHAFLDSYNLQNLNQYSESDKERYFELLDLFGAQFRDKPDYKKEEKEAFGKWYKKRFATKEAPDGLGSRLKVSAAYFLLPGNKVAEDLKTQVPDYLKERLDNLPVRKHVRIDDRGVASKNGLFDNEIIYKGARFIFEIELAGTTEDKPIWEEIINEFNNPAFRIGQGTRKGYGKLKVHRIYNQVFNLEKDFDSYLNHEPSFNANLNFTGTADQNYNGALSYHLSLIPDSFFIFSEGFGDTEADNRPLTEEVMSYGADDIRFVEQTIIPASSIKGALAHRAAFHYNKKKGNFSDEIAPTEFKNHIGDNNKAFKTLFGKKGDVGSKMDNGSRGIVILDDLYYDDVDNSKILNHVAIDRFTGGAIEGALFSEKVSYKKDNKIEFSVYLSDSNLEEEIIYALEEALKDICKGLLPLGGMTTKGHGMFTGTLKKNNETIYSYNNQTELV